MKIARIAVWFDEEAAETRWQYGMNAFERYLEELLSHRGIQFNKPDKLEELQRSRYDLVLVALSAENDRTMNTLYQFADEGGGVILYANMNRMAEQFGYAKTETIPTGYAALNLSTNTEEKEAPPLKFFEAVPWIPFSEDAGIAEKEGELYCNNKTGRDGSEETVPALLKFKVNSGFIDRWSVGIMQTIVRLQQGITPLTEDGVPALDGTGSVNDRILKADDTVAMNWDTDRRTTETGSPYFAYPYADEWREVVVGHIIQRAAEHGLSVPYIGYWPPGIEAVAMISHDSDGNVEEHGRTTLKLLEEQNIRSTWCMIESGYRSELYDQIRRRGHELAFHYNAIDRGGYWSESEFKRQLDYLRSTAGEAPIVSNKNHVTRFEGWGELFQWCERYGIESDQTRGSSKKGNVGFLFGTCHPYRPIAWSDEKNRLYDVMEIGFLTQDMEHGKWTDESVIEPFLETVRKVNGVAHFLFHQVHLHRLPKVREAFKRTVAEAKTRGFVFWTGKQINDFERFRRSLRIELSSNENELVEVTSTTQNKMDEEVVVFIPVPSKDSENQKRTTTDKYGVSTIRMPKKTSSLRSSISG